MADSYKRVLVVDDDPEVRRLLESVLRQRALTVHSAADGQQALDLLDQYSFSVILLDLLMPVVDGFRVLEVIRDREFQPQPVILVLTGADRSTIDALDAQLIHGIVRKPFDPNELASIVVACTEIRARGSLETMALAVMSGGPLLDLLRRFGG